MTDGAKGAEGATNILPSANRGEWMPDQDRQSINIVIGHRGSLSGLLF
jgi:uncharacterized protein (UPF0248 family)